jgi:hypothetical protein
MEWDSPSLELLLNTGHCVTLRSNKRLVNVHSEKVRAAAESSLLSDRGGPRQPGGGLTCQAHLPRLISRLPSYLQRPSPGSGSTQWGLSFDGLLTRVLTA